MIKMLKLLLSGFQIVPTTSSRNVFRTTCSVRNCRNLTGSFRNKSTMNRISSGISIASRSTLLSFQTRLNHSESEILTPIEYEAICNETLDSLCVYFEELLESSPQLKGSDVVFGDGVLTVHFGDEHGTYVINRQSPNLQIWLSSPTSGPKRYDFVTSEQAWIYKHDNKSLHQLLQEEIPPIIGKDIVNFNSCSYSGNPRQ